MARRRMRRPPASTPEMEEGVAPAVDLGQLSDALRVISRSFAAIALRLAPSRPKTGMERISFLDGLGLDTNEIAGIVGTSPDAVRAQLSDARSKTRRNRKARGKN